APLDNVLRFVAELIDRQEPSGICSISLFDADGALRIRAAPKLPPGFVAAVGRVAMCPDHCAHRPERFIISDVAKDPSFAQYRELALAHGLRACSSTPIRAREGAVLGTLAVYHARPHTPKEREI